MEVTQDLAMASANVLGKQLYATKPLFLATSLIVLQARSGRDHAVLKLGGHYPLLCRIKASVAPRVRHDAPSFSSQVPVCVPQKLLQWALHVYEGSAGSHAAEQGAPELKVSLLQACPGVLQGTRDILEALSN